LKAGISSLIQSTNQNLLTSDHNVDTKKSKMPPPPSEARPLYEILEETKTKGGDSSEIF
jgi:hypothetical protein